MTEQTATPTAAEAPGARWLALANETTDPLNCIAMALTGILELGVRSGELEAADDDRRALVDQLDTELGERDGTLAAVRAALGKSTSQVAEKVRAALGDAPAKAETPELTGAVPEPDGSSTQLMEEPARGDSVEQWRVYAGQEGFGWNETEGMNRSQIRSLLGISNA